MSQVIYKYPLKPLPEQTLTIKGLVRCLDIEVQRADICVWALRYKEDESFERDLRIRIIGTGHMIDDEILKEWTYWKTLHMNGGSLILHVFVDMGHIIGR